MSAVYGIVAALGALAVAALVAPFPLAWWRMRQDERQRQAWFTFSTDPEQIEGKDYVKLSKQRRKA